MADWQLIFAVDPALKDGRDVLAAFHPGGRQLVVRWNTADKGWITPEGQRRFPTHIQELGAPPDPPPPPAVSAIDPSTAALGSPSFTLHVLGTGFFPNAVILWNGSPEQTTVVSATELTTTVNMASAEVAMEIPVAVQNGDGQI